MDFRELLVLFVTSGLAAGLASVGGTLLAGRWERRHRTQERTAIQQHEAKLRRELAHDVAREKYLPIAIQFRAWADKHVGEVHWEEVGEFVNIGTSLPIPGTREEVLDCLRNLMYGHPTAAVRQHARNLHNDVINQWGEIVGDTIPDPTLDQALDWYTRADKLIELIHTPEDHAAD